MSSSTGPSGTTGPGAAPSSPAPPIAVVVAGALGRMGAEVVKAVTAAPDCELVGAIDTTPGKEGADVGLELGLGELEVAVTADFEGCLCQASQAVRTAGPGLGAVLVDFTHPSVVFEHTRGAIAYGVHPVIGTTGLSPEQLADLATFAAKASVGGAVIPNFSVGMVLLQQAAAAAARFYDFAELTELHHNRKADAPSGTCIKTAELIEELGKSFNLPQVEEHETLAGCRGGLRESGLRLHSIRLPGLVAHQEVMFGAPGETYTAWSGCCETSRPMLIPLRPGELPRLIPAVATGPQFNACSGSPRKLLQRVLISVIGGVLTLLISQTLAFRSQFAPVLLVAGVVLLLYVLWGPIVEAGRRNATLRRYPAAAIFEGEVADLFTREVVEDQREQADRSGRLQLVENRRTWLTLELEDEDGYLGRVMVVRTLVLSDRKDFSRIGALTDAWLPQLKLWVGDYPFLLRPAFEELCLRRLR